MSEPAATTKPSRAEPQPSGGQQQFAAAQQPECARQRRRHQRMDNTKKTAHVVSRQTNIVKNYKVHDKTRGNHLLDAEYTTSDEARCTHGTRGGSA